MLLKSFLTNLLNIYKANTLKYLKNDFRAFQHSK
nr:MAG TPA: hypothetical protein [Caudoviricetes sp.]